MSSDSFALIVGMHGDTGDMDPLLGSGRHQVAAYPVVRTENEGCLGSVEDGPQRFGIDLPWRGEGGMIQLLNDRQIGFRHGGDGSRFPAPGTHTGSLPGIRDHFSVFDESAFPEKIDHPGLRGHRPYRKTSHPGQDMLRLRPQFLPGGGMAGGMGGGKKVVERYRPQASSLGLQDTRVIQVRPDSG